MKRLCASLAAALGLGLFMTQTAFAGGEVPVKDSLPKWWQRTTAYEIYVSSFQDSNGDGIGDLNGIRSRLPYLKELGVGAVWLTPVYASPMVDNGYDISDYTSINPLYGTMEDMEQLIREADRQGIRIVMDLVFNHSSDQHPWFLESKQSRDNPKSDWYIWRDPQADGSAPNNWRGIFGGSAWTWCEERQQYYLHTFAEAQPDLNWENPEVRQALADVAIFWENKGVGGFRMDAIPYIKKPAGLPSGAADAGDGMVSIHDMTSNREGILDYLHEFKRKALDGRDVFTVAEANGVRPEDLKYWVGTQGVFDMLFEFSHVRLEFPKYEVWCQPEPWSPADLKQVLRASQEATRDNGWYPAFFENHDQPRSPLRYYPGFRTAGAAAAGAAAPGMAGADSAAKLPAKALGTILLTLRGTPFLYQGEELGLRNASWDSVSVFNDLSTVNQYQTALSRGFGEAEALRLVSNYSRDNARTPMQWDESANAGFTTGTPWLPVHGDYRAECVAAEERDPSSVLRWYRDLAKLRKSAPALQYGDFEELAPADPAVFSYRRSLPGEQSYLVVVNLTAENAQLPEAVKQELNSSGAAPALILCSCGDGNADGSAGETLRPAEARIYALK